MLANQERDLTGLDFSALQELRTALDDSRRLLDEAQGLSFDVEQARRTFGRLYPDSYGADASAGQMARDARSEEHTSELQSLMRSSYAVFCLNKHTIYIYPVHSHTSST